MKSGDDRQELYEAIQVHSTAAGAVMKSEEKPNDLMEHIKKDASFLSVHDKIEPLVTSTLCRKDRRAD